VLDRFVEFLPPNADPRKITRADLTDFMVRLKNKRKLDNNTAIHQMIIVAQFLKRHGKGAGGRASLLVGCEPYAQNRRVTLKPEFAVSPKRWEEREVPVVAVGTAITDRPPRRSVRAELPHTAPA
jgi:hypothetical protein